MKNDPTTPTPPRDTIPAPSPIGADVTQVDWGPPRFDDSDPIVFTLDAEELEEE